MAEDARRHLQKGMTRKQVRRLLGKPDFAAWENGAGARDDYLLGLSDWSGLGFLTIQYGSHGRVVASEISWGTD
jgi:hypothetical protein